MKHEGQCVGLLWH